VITGASAKADKAYEMTNNNRNTKLHQYLGTGRVTEDCNINYIAAEH